MATYCDDAGGPEHTRGQDSVGDSPSGRMACGEIYLFAHPPTPEKLYAVSISEYASPVKPRRDDGSWLRLTQSMTRKLCTMQEVSLSIAMQQVIGAWFMRSMALDSYLQSQVFGVDWDDETEESDIDRILKIPIVKNCAGILYTTQSSTPERPRSRALFFLSKPLTDPSAHKRHARALIGSLGGDMSCSSPNKLFHGTGPDGTVITLGNEYDSTMMNSVTEDWEAATVKHYPRTNSQTTDDSEIVSALSVIPPDIPYDEWVQVLMAIHSAHPDETGIAICESWAPGYPGEIEQKFRGFGRSTGVTVRSLFYLAKKYKQ